MRLAEARARTGRKSPDIHTPGLKKNTTGKRLASQIVKEFFTPSKKLLNAGCFLSRRAAKTFLKIF